MIKTAKIIFTLLFILDVATIKADEKNDYFEVSAYPHSLSLQDSKLYLVTFADLSAQYFALKSVEGCLSIAIQKKSAVIIKHHKKTLVISECRPK